MAYLDTQPLSRRLASLGTAGAIELAIGAVLIAGLSVTIIPKEEAPQLSARNIPVPEPVPPEPQPSAAPMDTVITAPQPPIRLDPQPQPMPTPNIDLPPFPVPSAAPTFEPRQEPAPRPSLAPVTAAPRNDPASWVTTNDYPARDLREGNQGTTQFRVVVGTNGRVQSCDVIRSSGFATLDKAACAAVTRRARFEPATDQGGAKVVGSFTSSVRWQIPR